MRSLQRPEVHRSLERAVMRSLEPPEQGHRSLERDVKLRRLSAESR